MAGSVPVLGNARKADAAGRTPDRLRVDVGQGIALFENNLDDLKADLIRHITGSPDQPSGETDDA
ncbi:hypothetical protein [Antarctobacter sp.]|uniref:hypothetical protein n=1 Tax=Antarctobacter sp. TaxID=1872577 RepID=UPI003A8F672A